MSKFNGLEILQKTVKLLVENDALSSESKERLSSHIQNMGILLENSESEWNTHNAVQAQELFGSIAKEVVFTETSKNKEYKRFMSNVVGTLNDNIDTLDSKFRKGDRDGDSKSKSNKKNKEDRQAEAYFTELRKYMNKKDLALMPSFITFTKIIDKFNVDKNMTMPDVTNYQELYSDWRVFIG